MEVGGKRDGRRGQIPWGSRKGKQAKTSINSTPPSLTNTPSIYSAMPYTHNHISNGGRTGHTKGGDARLTLLKGFLMVPL